MTQRNVHIVHLLVRQNLPEGRVGFLLYPHEHWKAPTGEPYLALPAKKTVEDPPVDFIHGMPLQPYIDEIALHDWQIPSIAYRLDQEFEAALWTVPSAGQKDDDRRAVPTRYTVYPVEVWVAPERREALRERLDGRWLTPPEALAEPWLSPTARGVFDELRKRRDHFLAHPPKPEEKKNSEQAEALCRLFGPVSDRPRNDNP